MSKFLNKILTQKRTVMKKMLEVDMSVVNEYGAIAGIVLAVVNNSYEPVSNTDVANQVGCTFPTAKKTLELLVEKSYIKQKDKRYFKN
jgi:hypothetical protein